MNNAPWPPGAADCFPPGDGPAQGFDQCVAGSCGVALAFPEMAEDHDPDSVDCALDSHRTDTCPTPGGDSLRDEHSG